MKNILSFVILLSGFFANAQAIPTDKIDTFIDYIEQHDRAIGNVSLFKEGKEIYYRDFGQRAVPELQPDRNARYMIGSITKMVTATLILKLAEENKLSLTDKLSEFYPKMPNAKSITIEQLLGHTSGLGDVNFKDGTIKWLKEKKVGDAALLKQIRHQGALFKPGKDFSYSNSGYFLLGKILEKKYGKPFSEIVKEQVATPLHLSNFISPDSTTAGVLHSYRFSGGNWQSMPDFIPENIRAYGDMAATTTDLNAFAEALFQNRIISKESVDLMKPKKGSYFGLGMMAVPFYQIMLYGHGGDTDGSHTLLAYDEKEKISVAIAIHGDRSIKSDFYSGILNALYNGTLPYPLFVADEILNRYEGIYYCKGFPFKLKIFNEGGTLYGEGIARGQIPFQLKAKSDTEFYRGNEVQTRFDIANNKMYHTESGETFEFTKQ